MFIAFREAIWILLARLKLELSLRLAELGSENCLLKCLYAWWNVRDSRIDLLYALQLNAECTWLSYKAKLISECACVTDLKVDTHVHHSACMHQKHLLRFIKSKLRKEPDEVVIFRDGKYLTLKEVFESLNLTG